MQERDRYEFRPHSLVDLRATLNLKQKEMAGLIGVPQNTLSRWETGATAPDALNLAKIYGIAVERGEEIEFFVRRRPKAKKRRGEKVNESRLLVILDVVHVSITASNASGINDSIRKELAERFPGASHQIFKAFAEPNQYSVTDQLMELGWRVWEDTRHIDEELESQAKADCGHEPEETTLMLITNHDGYAELIKELQEWGVDVYLGELTGRASPLLRSIVGSDKAIFFQVAPWAGIWGL